MEKYLNSRIIHKHDTEENWNKATNFIPKKGELIVYDKDSTYDYERFKIGDGVTVVSNLAFATYKTTIDSTLSVSGNAADAKATGDAISNLSDLVGDVAVSEQISTAIADKQQVPLVGSTNPSASNYVTPAQVIEAIEAGRDVIISALMTFENSDIEHTFTFTSVNVFNGDKVELSFMLSDALVSCIGFVNSDGTSSWNPVTTMNLSSATNLVNGTKSGSLRTVDSAEENSEYKVGQSAFAEGVLTKASGEFAHAEGDSTVASGGSSHAEGSSTIAASPNQHTQGKFNIEDSSNTYVDIIGNGTNDTARSNAATVDWSGNAWYAGDVYVGSTSGTNRDDGSKKLATEEYVDTAVTNKQDGPLIGTIDTTADNYVTPAQVIEAVNSGRDVIVIVPSVSMNGATVAQNVRLTTVNTAGNTAVVCSMVWNDLSFELYGDIQNGWSEPSCNNLPSPLLGTTVTTSEMYLSPTAVADAMNKGTNVILATMYNDEIVYLTSFTGFNTGTDVQIMATGHMFNGIIYVWATLSENTWSEATTEAYATKDSLNGKIDKVDGKGLSTNDYTNEDKTKLTGIETGATKTTVDSALSSTSANPVQNKVIATALDGKLDKSGGTITGDLALNGNLNITSGNQVNGDLNFTGDINLVSNLTLENGCWITFRNSTGNGGVNMYQESSDDSTPKLSLYGAYADEAVILNGIAIPTNDSEAANKVYVDNTLASGTAGKATKLATARYIDGVKFDGSANVTRYATCSTAAATAAKTASITAGTFSLITGARVTVRFTYANTASSPTLNVGETGAKPIYWHNVAIPSTQYWSAYSTLDFVYTGNAWELIGVAKDNNTTYPTATTSTNGLLPALSGSSSEYLRGDGQWATVSSSSGGMTREFYTGKISVTSYTTSTDKSKIYTVTIEDERGNRQTLIVDYKTIQYCKNSSGIYNQMFVVYTTSKTFAIHFLKCTFNSGGTIKFEVTNSSDKIIQICGFY